MIDIIIIVIVIAGALWGYATGLVGQVISVVGMIAGFWVAQQGCLWLADDVFLHIFHVSAPINRVIAFLLIWILVWIVCRLVGRYITYILKIIWLGGLNRILGFLVGGLKWVVILGLLIYVLDTLDTSNRFISAQSKEESNLYDPVKRIVSNFFPVIERSIYEHLEETTKK